MKAFFSPRSQATSGTSRAGRSWWSASYTQLEKQPAQRGLGWLGWGTPQPQPTQRRLSWFDSESTPQPQPTQRRSSWFDSETPKTEKTERSKLGAPVVVFALVLATCSVLLLAGHAVAHRSRDVAKTPATVEMGMLKAVGYAPIPLTGSGQDVKDDDMMSSNASAMWGPDGRRDLKTISSLGANAIRLYGNDPLLDHSGFLDEAEKEGLHVIAGISDYPYTQMDGACKFSKYDCYLQIKQAYEGNLQRGFLRGSARYHPALHTVVLVNEPDLKVSEDSSVVAKPEVFCKAIISAFDAVLDAEKEAGVQGHLPNFTATFSFGVCYHCENATADYPAIGQMLALREAMRNPRSLGYHPRNDLWKAYHTRFTNSVNTENRAEEFRENFLNRYDARFQGTPFFIGEYHAPPFAQGEDLQRIVNMSRNTSSLLMGLAFFEFQVRYDKGGDGEMSFGMFGLGDHELGSFYIWTKKMTVYCLKPVRGGEADEVLHLALAEAFNGTGVPRKSLCPGTPEQDLKLPPQDPMLA